MLVVGCGRRLFQPRQGRRITVPCSSYHLCAGFYICIDNLVAEDPLWSRPSSVVTTTETGGGGVAYLAHAGGFVVGLVVGVLYRGRARQMAEGRPMPRA